jgi:hypothetical protein
MLELVLSRGRGAGPSCDSWNSRFDQLFRLSAKNVDTINCIQGPCVNSITKSLEA